MGAFFVRQFFHGFLILLVGTCLLGCADQGWQLNSDTDPIHDTTRIVAILQGLDGSSWAEAGCGKQGPFVSFNFATRTTTTTVRAGKNPPVELSQHLNFDDVHLALVTGPEAAALIGEILDSESMFVRRKDGSALTQTDHHYALGSREALETATAPCTSGYKSSK